MLQIFGLNPKDYQKKLDGILAYMYLMVDKARSAHIKIQGEEFVKLGADLEAHSEVEF